MVLEILYLHNLNLSFYHYKYRLFRHEGVLRLGFFPNYLIYIFHVIDGNIENIYYHHFLCYTTFSMNYPWIELDIAIRKYILYFHNIHFFVFNS